MYICIAKTTKIVLPIGGLAQLARAFDWQSKGHRFDSDILHIKNKGVRGLPLWALFSFAKAQVP